MANVGIAPSSQDLEFRCADAAMTKDLKAARSKSQQTAAPLIPPKPTLASLRVAAASCKACDLWERATQTVFGEGSLVIRSWVQPEGCLIRLWQRLASREVMYMLRMW